jgi:hypothetical protein
MIDQATINRRDMLLVGSSILATTAISATPAAAQTQMPARQKKTETEIPPSIITGDESHAWASRGRRVS